MRLEFQIGFGCLEVLGYALAFDFLEGGHGRVVSELLRVLRWGVGRLGCQTRWCAKLGLGAERDTLRFLKITFLR